jgi:hypothetical protein
MSGDIVRLAHRRPLTHDDIAARLGRMSSILVAIDAGELLAACPESPFDQTNHLAALDLLSLLHAEIILLRNELQ